MVSAMPPLRLLLVIALVAFLRHAVCLRPLAWLVLMTRFFSTRMLDPQRLQQRVAARLADDVLIAATSGIRGLPHPRTRSTRRPYNRNHS